MKNNIRAVRESLGVGQSDLARRAGMSPQSVYRIEQGVHDLSDSTLRRIAEALEVEPSQLLPAEVVEAVRDEIRTRHRLILAEAARWGMHDLSDRPGNPLDNVVGRTA